jgi:hypothetical protein
MGCGGKSLFLCVFLLAVLFLSLNGFVSAGYIYCNDSDSGLNYGVYGNVGTSYVSVPTEEQITRTYDTCYQYSSPASVCNGETCYIRETYCGGTYGNDLNYSLVSCYSLGYSSCADGECSGVYPTPAAVNCSDGIKNQDETDIDCGGVSCSGCDAGEDCSTSYDCLSTICSGGVCYETPGNVSLHLSLGDNDPGNHVWNDSSGYNVMMQLEVYAEGDVELQEMEFSTSGTGNEINVVSIIVYEDNGELGEYDSFDTYLGSSSLLSDNTDLVIDLNDYFVDEDHVNLIVVYHMNVGTQIGTYILSFEELRGNEQGNLNNELSAVGNYENTKTVVQSYVIPHCYNGVMDSYYGETGIDCGGLDCMVCYEPWVAPECVSSEMSCPSWMPPLCDVFNGMVYSCVSGILTPMFADYDLYCGEGGCYDGDIICNHQEKDSFSCNSGVWIYSEDVSDYFSRCRIGTDCDWTDNELYCYSDSEAYFCNEYGEYVEVVPGEKECDMVCNWDEILCDYNEQVMKVCDGYGWYPIEEEESYRYYQGSGPGGATEVDLFGAFCGANSVSCTTGEKRCGILNEKMEVCEDNRWILIDGSEEEFNQQCSGIDCRKNWFKCNPFTEEVSFCSGTTWGTPRKSNYEDYCIQDLSTSGPGPQVITGEIVNNTVVVYKYLENDVSKKKSIIDFGKPLYWIVGGIILIILISLIVYFATKYSTVKSLKKK